MILIILKQLNKLEYKLKHKINNNMANSKHRKDHKKKVASFKKKAQDDKNRSFKQQKNLIMQLIEQEKKRGLFDQDKPLTDGPVIDGPSI